MAAKSANLYARIEPDVKEKAESILSALGIPVSSAINMFYKLEKGYSDMQAGRTKNEKKAFADIRNDYGI